MAQTFATIDQGTQTGTQIFGHLDDRTTTLRSCFAGDDPPSSPLTGQLWFETDTLTLYYWDGTQWVVVGSVVTTNIDVNSNQLVNARMENTASDATPASGNVGYVYLHTGTGKLTVVASASVLERVVSLSNADLWSIPLPLRSWQKDATNPPTEPGAVGTTPEFHGWLFDATNERMHTTVVLPRGFSEDADLILRVHYLLNVAESASDVLAAVVDYKKLTLDSTDSATGTPTQAAASSQSIGANAGQYTYHKCDIVLAYNDANNPLVRSDLLALSWGLSAVASVSAALVVHAELLSPVGRGTITEVA